MLKKKEKERQILYENTCEWNLKEPNSEKQREQSGGYEGWGCGKKEANNHRVQT